MLVKKKIARYSPVWLVVSIMDDTLLQKDTYVLMVVAMDL